MTSLIERTLHRLGMQLSGRLSKPRDDRYAAATAKPVATKTLIAVTSEAIRMAVGREARDVIEKVFMAIGITLLNVICGSTNF